MNTTIRILGIDPGLRLTGWGVIEQTGSRLTHIDHGVIKIPPDASLSARLFALQSEVKAVIGEFKPALSCVEETFVNVSARSSLALGHARGVILASLAGAGIDVLELAPRSIKKTVVGTGRADKAQVQFMVQRLLPRAGDMTSDSADALACAICAAHMSGPMAMRRSA